MVLIAQRRGQPRACGPLGAPRPAASCWREAEREQKERPTLPAFSMRRPRQPSGLEGGAAFKRAAAALPLDASADSQWAGSASLVSLRSFGGTAEPLQLQPQQAVPLPAEGPALPLPPFLHLRVRTPITDEWVQRAASTLDAPCLPSAAAEGKAQVGACGCCLPCKPQPMFRLTLFPLACGCRPPWLPPLCGSAECSGRTCQRCCHQTERQALLLWCCCLWSQNFSAIHLHVVFAPAEAPLEPAAAAAPGRGRPSDARLPAL